MGNMTETIDYKRKYFKIYFWQIFSVLLGFASLFLIVPYLSSDKTLYGIYSVCTSLTIFFSYADLGFISAGVKYAAEYYIKGDVRNEMKVVGFTAFIMITAFAILALSISVLAIFPELLVPDVEIGGQGYIIARGLLVILALSCPIIIGQRILGIIFTIRVEDYIYQRMMIVGNIARIVSVFYFFGGNNYMVVEYYAFYQTVNLLVVFFLLIYARNYGYKIKDFIYSIRFDRTVFNKVKKISFTSLVMTLCMVLYYEFDQIAISHIIGIEAVAIYSVALTVLSIIRSFCSILYSPYTSRYNHFYGLNDIKGLTDFSNTNILTLGPILIVPILIVSLFSEPFVVSWLGDKYIESAELISILVLSFLPNMITNVISPYFVATENNRILLKTSLILPFLYWVIILCTFSFLGVHSFAWAKTISPFVVAVSYWFLAKKDFTNRGFQFVGPKEVFAPLIVPIISLIVVCNAVRPYMKLEHNHISLLINIGIMTVSGLIGITIMCVIVKQIRDIVSKAWSSYYNKINGN